MLPHARAIALSILSSAGGFSAAYLTLRPRTPAPRFVPACASTKPSPIAVATPCISLPPTLAPSTSLPPTLPPSTLPPPTLLPPSLAPTARSSVRAPLLASFRIVGIGPGGGLRLGRVLPQSLAAAIGLQSGDELLSINRFQLANPEQALTAYARLRTADRLTLAVARRGQRTEIVYSIR